MKLNGFRLTGSDHNGVIVESSVDLQNPSGLTIAGLGAVSVELSSQGHHIAGVSVDNLHVDTPSTEISCSGHIKPTDPPSAATVFSTWLSGLPAPVDYSVSPMNQSLPSWAKATLGQLSGTVDIPSYDGPPLIASMMISSASFSASAAGDLSMSADVIATVQTPFNFPFQVESSICHIDILDSKRGSVVGKVVTPRIAPEWHPSSDSPGNGKLHITMKQVVLTPQNPESLSRVMAGFLEGTATFWIQGTASVTTKSAMGTVIVDLPLKDVHVNFPIAFDHFRGMTVARMDMLDGMSGRLILDAETHVPNHSVMNLNIEPCLHFIPSYKGEDVGTAVSCKTSLKADGTSITQARIEMFGTDAKSQLHAHEAIVHYINGEDFSVDCRGAPKGVDGPAYPVLGPAMLKFQAQTLMKGLDKGIITAALVRVLIDIHKLPQIVVPVNLQISNPWSGRMQIMRVDAQIYAWNGHDYGLHLAEISKLDISSDPLVIEGGDKFRNKPQEMHSIPITMLLEACVVGDIPGCINAMKQLLVQGSVPVRITCTMKCLVGQGYEIDIGYKQDGIPVSASFLEVDGQLGNTSSAQGQYVPPFNSTANRPQRDFQGVKWNSPGKFFVV